MPVSIRPWKLSDAADLADAMNNLKVQDNLRDGIPWPYTEKDALSYLSGIMVSDKDSEYAFAITYDGKVIGSIAVSRLTNVHKLTAEMGYFIAEPFWGRGITTEAVGQVCAYVFDHSDILRIFAEPYDYNIASCRVLEKSCFRLEGVLRQNAIKNGRILDMRMYSMLKSEFRAPLAADEKRGI